MKKFWLLIFISALTGVSVAKAQDVSVLQQELEDMREDIKILQRRAYNNEDRGDTVVQVSRLDEQVRSTSGKLDELEYKIRQLDEKIDMINRDIDVRIKLLEGKKIDSSVSANVPDNTPKFAAPVATDAPQSIVGGSISGGDLKPANGDTAPEIYQSGLEALKANRYADAEKAFTKVVTRFSDDKLAGNAQYWLGETFYARQEYEKSAVAFAKGYQQYHSNVKAADSLLKLGMSMKALKKNKEACAAFTSLPTEFPKADKNVKDKAAAEKKNLGCK